MQRILLALALLFTLASAAQAQLNVRLDIKRNMYYRYEPMLVTVTIQNLSGRDLMLEDGGTPWFGFTILAGEGKSLLPPRNPNYTNDPLEIKIGETLKRTVDITQLYPMGEYGTHRIQANIYCKPYDKYFASQVVNVEIGEGRTIWQQTVGVPDTLPNAGSIHEISLLSAPGTKHQYLYCRVREPATGTVYRMQRIGHLIDGAPPEKQFDSTNTLHVLQLAGPKTYTLTQIGVNGEIFGQWVYDAPKSRPRLRRDATGNVDVIGGVPRVQAAKNAPPAPKLSDRPKGLPKVQ